MEFWVKKNISSFEQFFDSLLYYPFLLNYGVIMVCENIEQCHVTLFVSIWNVEFDSTIFLTFATTMRPTSAAKHFSVLSLLEQGYSYCQIHNKTSISLGTIIRLGRKWMLTKETILVAVPPSFLPMTSSPLSDKSILGGLTMLFRLQILLIPLLHTLSILKLSGMH